MSSFAIHSLDELYETAERLKKLSQPESPLTDGLANRNRNVCEYWSVTYKKLDEQASECQDSLVRVDDAILWMRNRMAELESQKSSAESDEVKNALMQEYLECETELYELQKTRVALESHLKQIEVNRAELVKYRDLFDNTDSFCRNADAQLEKKYDIVAAFAKKLLKIHARLRNMA